MNEKCLAADAANLRLVSTVPSLTACPTSSTCFWGLICIHCQKIWGGVIFWSWIKTGGCLCEQFYPGTSSYFVSFMTTSGKYLYFFTKMVQNVFLIKKCLNSIFVNKYFKKPDRNLVGGSAQCTESSNKFTCWMTTTLRNLIKFDFFLTNACYLIIKKYFLKNLWQIYVIA